MSTILESMGGLGLFLFGMSIMTSGLRKLAGDRMHRWLGRATRTPFTGVLTGAGVTAIVQSSSATTVAAVGFVGAGLITFPQSLGILFGANIGTTLTGWIVAMVGFKLKLATAALPLLLLAAILYLAKNRRVLRGSGKALAGFALLFLGISYLQSGMSGARDLINLSGFDASSVGGRILIVAVGALLTLVTQSSSATVAATLTALHTGIIDLPQAAAAVIGADIGTTVTAGLATIGGNTGSRRTAFAHVFFNLLAGTGAFLVLPLYLWAWERFAPGVVTQSPEVVAVAFHTIFNTTGVLLLLPFTRPFARFIERLFPQRESPLVASLDPKLLADPGTAADALTCSVGALASSALRTAASRLSERRHLAPPETLNEVLDGINEARAFAVRTGEVTAETDSDLNAERLFATLHLIDHAERFAERARRADRLQGLLDNEELRLMGNRVADQFACLAGQIESGAELACLPALRTAAAELESDKSKIRADLIKRAAAGQLGATELDRSLGAARWLRRLTYHAWRMAHYWSEGGAPGGAPSNSPFPSADSG